MKNYLLKMSIVFLVAIILIPNAYMPAEASPKELPTVTVAMSDDQSIIVERILHETPHVATNEALPIWESNPGQFRLMIVVAGLLLTIICGLIMFLKVLAKRQTEAREASLAKSAFLAKISHEIRTPINAILGMTSLALREQDPDEVRIHIQTAKQAGSILLSIINDILDLSKIESGTLKIQSSDYSLSSLVNDVVCISKIKMDESGIQCFVDLDSSIPDILSGDEIRIRQVLINLLGNAGKYTKKGYVALKIRGDMLDKHTINLTMQISDSGRGIKPEDIDKLFSEYYQADNSRWGYSEGMGLGLSITSKLVHAMGGDISVDSEYGKGSTFTVSLPQKISTQIKQAIIPSAVHESIASGNVSAPKISIADIEVDGLHAGEGLVLSGGSEDRYIQVLTSFCEDGHERIPMIKKALGTGDLNMFATVVRALKSASESIGATKLSEMAACLEEAGSLYDTAYIEAHTDEFITAIEKIAGEINEALSARRPVSTDPDNQADLKKLKDTLVTLKAALDNMDLFVMNSSVDNLINLPKSEKTAAQVRTIVRNILMGEYDEATELSESIIADLTLPIVRAG